MGFKRKMPQISMLVLALAMTSACSQSRRGSAGRFESVYLLDPVSLCSNLGCFSVQMNVVDDIAYVDITGVQSNIANERLRIVGRGVSSGFEQLRILDGDDVSANTFRAIPGTYIIVSGNGSQPIYNYDEWFIETTTTENTGTGLVRLPAALGSGTLVTHGMVVDANNLQQVLGEMGWNNYAAKTTR